MTGLESLNRPTDQRQRPSNTILIIKCDINSSYCDNKISISIKPYGNPGE